MKNLLFIIDSTDEKVKRPVGSYLLHTSFKLLRVDVKVQIECKHDDLTPDPCDRVWNADHGDSGPAAGALLGPVSSMLRAEQSVFHTGEHETPSAQPPARRRGVKTHGTHDRTVPLPVRSRLLAAVLAGTDHRCTGYEAAELPACGEAADPLHQSGKDTALRLRVHHRPGRQPPSTLQLLVTLCNSPHIVPIMPMVKTTYT